MFAEGDTIDVHDFQHGRDVGREETSAAAPRRVTTSHVKLQAPIGEVEQEMIRASKARHQGNQKRVAGELGFSRSYLYKKLAEAP